MSSKPYMPLWTGDYLKKTRHLHALEHGAYLLLMMECWERPSGSLPNNPKLLARLACVTEKEWSEISDVVMEFFKLNKRKNEYTQERVTEELEKVRTKRASAQQSAATRWNKKKKPNANALPPQSERNANHTHSQQDKKYTKEFELFFTEFPNQQDKHAASKNFTKEKKFTTAKHLTECAKIYSQYVEETKTDCVYKAKNFIRQKYYENYQPVDQNLTAWEAKLNAYEKGQWLPEWGDRPGLNGWKQADHGIVPEGLETRFMRIVRDSNSESIIGC